MCLRKWTRFICPTFPFYKSKEINSSAKRVHVFTVNFGDFKGVVVQQNDILQELIQEVHNDSIFHGTKTSRTPVSQSNRYAEWVRCMAVDIHMLK